MSQVLRCVNIKLGVELISAKCYDALMTKYPENKVQLIRAIKIIGTQTAFSQMSKARQSRSALYSQNISAGLSTDSVNQKDAFFNPINEDENKTEEKK